MVYFILYAETKHTFVIIWVKKQIFIIISIKYEYKNNNEVEFPNLTSQFTRIVLRVNLEVRCVSVKSFHYDL